ncbi:PD40 domain-containing protein [Candidatus Fermentibacterales bacterium]|nr:PD40 domain-containing protein [Candidatus Fermentibacterales bacterium]
MRSDDWRVRVGAVLLGAAILVLCSCGDNPDEPEPWPDGALFYVGWTGCSDSSLAFSPYGNVLLFTGTHVPTTAPDVFGFDGLSNPLQLTSSVHDESTGPNGCWHPDVGSLGRVVYVAVIDDSTSEIRTTPGNLNGPKVALADSLPHLHPTWMPDASGMLFSTFHNGHWALFTGVYDPDTYLLDSTQVFYEPGLDCLRASYSPDGGSILYQQSDGSGGWDIWIMGADGSDPHAVISGSSMDIHPCWGPDGDWFAFSSDRTGQYEVYIAPVSGDTLIPVTGDPADDLYAAWNPDGDWIAFVSDRESGDGTLDIFSIDVPQH